VQADLAAAGVPAPVPLAGPQALGAGWLTVEEYRDGDSADGYDPAVRRGMATALHDFVDAARPHIATDSIGTWLGEAVIDDVWPEPHDLRFDFAGTARGAEWIDATARAARATLAATTLPNVVGHLDWRVQNLAFAGSQVSAIYDWDSVRLVPEAALVGSASVIHPVDWRLEQPDPLPTLEQLDGFVADYESVRGVPSTMTNARSSSPDNTGSPATAPDPSTPTTFSASSQTSTTRWAGPASRLSSETGSTPPLRPRWRATLLPGRASRRSVTADARDTGECAGSAC
jgi:hypothetical protein